MKTSTQRMLQNSAYPFILAWGRMTGSMDYYIERQQAQAAQDGATMFSTYYCMTEKKWRTAFQITTDHARDYLRHNYPDLAAICESEWKRIDMLIP